MTICKRLALKAVKQRYVPTLELLTMMDTFRHVTNDCIRIGLEHNKTSLKSLSGVAYQPTKRINLLSKYRLCAISKAAGILSNYRKLIKKGRKVRQPYCWKPVLTTCYGVKVKDDLLHLPGKVRIPLNKHSLQVLSQPGLVIHSATLNANHLSISFSKQTDGVECTGMIGIDRNLDNVTVADTDGNVIVHDLSEANDVKAQCTQTKGRFKRNDVRVRRALYSKYGQIQKNRVNSILHNVSKKIVEHAKANKLAIAMENIKGIRKLYRAGNGQGNKYRGRMNSWSFYELQRQIQYKAEWEGLEVIYVNPRGTSVTCSICGDRMFAEQGSRTLRCNCGSTVDRDVNAARNILARGLRFKPDGCAGEAMVQKRQTEPNPESRCVSVQLAAVNEPIS